MRFPLSTGMAKNGNFIPVIERNRALIPGPKGNNGNKGGEYFPLQENSKDFLEIQNPSVPLEANRYRYSTILKLISLL